MSGPDHRPEIRIAFVMPDGSVETTGQYHWGHFETLPLVGDVLAAPAFLEDALEAVVVVGRQHIRPLGRDPRWWIVVRPAEGDRWAEVCQLDQDTDQALDEEREADSRASAQAFAEKLQQRKRLGQEAAAERKRLQKEETAERLRQRKESAAKRAARKKPKE